MMGHFYCPGNFAGRVVGRKMPIMPNVPEDGVKSLAREIGMASSLKKVVEDGDGENTIELLHLDLEEVTLSKAVSDAGQRVEDSISLKHEPENKDHLLPTDPILFTPPRLGGLPHDALVVLTSHCSRRSRLCLCQIFKAFELASIPHIYRHVPFGRTISSNPQHRRNYWRPHSAPNSRLHVPLKFDKDEETSRSYRSEDRLDRRGTKPQSPPSLIPRMDGLWPNEVSRLHDRPQHSPRPILPISPRLPPSKRALDAWHRIKGCLRPKQTPRIPPDDEVFVLV